MKETQTKPQNTDNTLGSLSYYELRLKELLQTSFPNLLADTVFIKDRSEYAAKPTKKPLRRVSVFLNVIK